MYTRNNLNGSLLDWNDRSRSLRSYCRIVFIRHVGLDDYFMVAALVVAIGLVIMNVFHISWGTGRHSDDLDYTKILIPTFKHW
jgi:hypothetical protein